MSLSTSSSLLVTVRCHKAKFPGLAPCKSAPSHPAEQLPLAPLKRHEELPVCVCASLPLKPARFPSLCCKQTENGRDTFNGNLVVPQSHRCSFCPQLMLIALLLATEETKRRGSWAWEGWEERREVCCGKISSKELQRSWDKRLACTGRNLPTWPTFAGVVV